MRNKLQVEAIRQGTVIDHIPAGQGIKILDRLQLLDSDASITVGFNLPSKDQGHKDIIKVTDRKFTEQEANQLALFAPSATINVIDNYEVVDKFKMALPDSLLGAFACPNSNCITHNEPVDTHFSLRAHQGDVRLKCKYCEKSFSKDIVSGL
ncbi:aspartate carbamoyltransferase regulatory subunit [Endozoicomonas montiporae]|uniref:Aspartate carbamoyltransferase regulatory chain n=2 Tax=Endozoicomonas montiporae TaxID=1027273 RepID=A0A081N2Q3_9GAMM|nr:aspartate carbamoyltransferase regulatory subunit [Endozoicomonas montiporae]AMO57986.1 aspartate carbamoyltransferase regulatory chain [Endozoicomonas montiporae CL-33]KEQ12726.1 aspartate carbamoyltransferase regulatory subunit [Endozoicomonas montiporae]